MAFQKEGIPEHKYGHEKGKMGRVATGQRKKTNHDAYLLLSHYFNVLSPCSLF